MSRAELEAARKAELEKKEKERETPGWAGGLKQQREAAERSAAMAAEAAKPFARTKCAHFAIQIGCPMLGVGSEHAMRHQDCISAHSHSCWDRHVPNCCVGHDS